MLEGVVQDGKGVKRLASDSPPASSKSVKLPRPVDEEQRSAAVFTIPVEAPAKYQRVLFGGIQKPTQITTFSYDERRTLHHDDRSRRYYHPPPRNADLNYGFERLVERDESIDEHLDSLLNSLMVLGQRNDDLDQSRRQAHVITWRGMMTRFCTLLYESRDSFEMNAMLIGETLYVEEHSSKAQNADKRWRNDERQRRLGYHGYSLESYCCHTWRTGHPGVDAWDGDVNTNVQWCSVVKTKLGSLRMVLGGEVDAVHSDDLTPVEVKASMQIRNGRDEERFEVKMLRFYMQSFLLGIQRIVVGFRDQRGFLVTHQEMETLAMPRAVRGKVSMPRLMSTKVTGADWQTTGSLTHGIRWHV